jgi:membrane-associated protease RseP (regulator of RpoE activity)
MRTPDPVHPADVGAAHPGDRRPIRSGVGGPAPSTNPDGGPSGDGGPARPAWREAVGEDPLGLTRHFERPQQGAEAAEEPPSSGWALFRLVGVIAAILVVAELAGVEETVLLVLAFFACIVLHEFGHFITSKWAGIKVTEFFVGFGPRLWSIQRGETEYGVKALPLGGYCRIIGMHNLDEVDPADEPRTYREAPLWRRLSVATAGSAMHFLIAICLLFALFFWTGDNGNYLTQLPASQPISAIDALTIPQSPPAAGAGSGKPTTQSPAQKAGFKVGDQVESIDGRTFADYNALHAFLEAHPDQRLNVTVRRDGRTMVLHPVPVNILTTIPASSTIVAIAGQASPVATTGGASPNPAAGSGLQVGDEVTSVDGQRLADFDALRSFVQSHPGPLPVTVTRAGRSLDLGSIDIPLAKIQVAGPQGEPLPASKPTGFIGIEMSSTIHSSFGQSISEAGGAWVHVSALTLDAFGHLVTLHGISTYFHSLTSQKVADSSTDNVRFESPVGVVRLFHQAGADGLATELWLLAVINLSLGLFNLIPLLPLDGGHVAIALYEGVRSRKGRRYHADVNKLLPLLYLAIAVIAFLGLSALFLDLRDLTN